MPEFTIQARPGPTSCPLCSETLAAGSPVQACPGCDVSYHVACLDELGGCGTLGCAKAKRGVASARRATPQPARGSSQPPLVIAALLAAALVGLLVVASKSSEPETKPLPQKRVQPIKRPLPQGEIDHFVNSVQFLVSIRQLKNRFGSLGADLKESLNANLDGAQQSYESFLESGGETPAEIRAELRRQVLEQVSLEDRAVAEQVMGEVFATVDKDPVFERSAELPLDALSELSKKQQRELRRAAELLATGRDRDDAEVRKHVEAAAAYGHAGRSDLSPDQQSELLQAARLIAAGKDRNHPDVQKHLNAAEAYEAAAGSDLSPEQQSELRQAAALLAAGVGRNDPEVLKHVEAAAAYGRAADWAKTSR